MLPPGPSAMAVFEVMQGLRRDPLNLLAALAASYGDVVRLRFWLWDVYLVWRPEHVKHVLQDRHAIYTKENTDYRVLSRALGRGLVTSTGEHWLRQRRLMQPAFHRSRTAALGTLVVERTKARLKAWEQRAKRGTAIDVQREMRRISLDVVTRSLFGVNVRNEARTIGRSFTELSEALTNQLYSPTFALFLLPWLPTPANLRARAALGTLDRVVRRIIAARRACASAPDDDLLAMLLHARDEETAGGGMDDRQIRDEVITLLLAGHETTAMALSWSCHLLAHHPRVEERMRSEIAALGDRDPTTDDLPRLGAVTRVIEETLRLYPPAWIMTRVATQPDELAGYRVPRGTIVLLSPWVTHRSPAVWPEPDRFDPDRFTAERSEGRARFACFPFSGGPRQCIGSDFAMTEATLALATIVRRYRLEPEPGRTIVPQPLITLRPRGGLPMIPRPRERCGAPPSAQRRGSGAQSSTSCPSGSAK